MESKASDLHPHQAEQPARARSPAKDDQNSAKAEESGVARRVCSAGRRTAMLAVIEEGRKGASAVPPAVPPASEAGRAAPRRETLLAVAGAGAGGWRRRGRLDGLIAGTQSRSGKGKKEETVSESVSGRESERAGEQWMYGEKGEGRERPSKETWSSLDKWPSACDAARRRGRKWSCQCRSEATKPQQKGAISSFVLRSDRRKTTTTEWKGLRMRYAPPLRRRRRPRWWSNFHAV